MVELNETFNNEPSNDGVYITLTTGPGTEGEREREGERGGERERGRERERGGREGEERERKKEDITKE